MTQRRMPSVRAGLILLALAGTLIACSSSAAVSPTAGGTPGPRAATVTLDEHTAGRTIRLDVGTTVKLVLHSTYWSVPHSSAPGVLRPVGAPHITRGTHCHPGVGCGTVEADFLIRRAGTAALTSTRTSCGEAMRCPPGSRVFTVTVTASPR